MFKSWWKVAPKIQEGTAISWLETCHSNGVELTLEEMLYYQSQTHLLNLSPRQQVKTRLSGNYLARSRGRGMEFDEVRQYQYGDDIRSIDWRVTARTGRTHTKLFREEKERPIFVFVDLSPSMFFGSSLLFKSIQACHIAALTAWQANKRGDKIGGVLFSGEQHTELKPKGRQLGVLQLLHSLSRLYSFEQQVQPGFFSSAVQRLKHIVHPGSLIVLISDFMQLDELSIRQLSDLSRHNEIIAYEVSDPLEQNLPNSRIKQNVALADAEHEYTITLGDTKTTTLYAESMQASFKLHRQQLQQLKIPVIEVSAGVPLPEHHFHF